MKFTKIMSASLITTLGLGLLAPVALADSQVKSDGFIEVTDGVLDPDKNLVDPEEPDKEAEVDEGITPGEVGNLTILGVSKLYFPTVSTSSNAVSEFAAASQVLDKETQQPLATGNFVQYGDIRGNESGYTLSAKLTRQFTKVEDGNLVPTVTLSNATLNYGNSVITTNTTSYDEGDLPNPGTLLGSFELGENSDAVEVVTAGADQGKGVYSVEFGQTERLDDKWVVAGTKTAEDSSASAVSINIPRTTALNMETAAYEAEITWTLTAAE